MNRLKNTRSFWDGKDYRFWEETAPGDESDSIPWATKCFLQTLLPALEGRSVLDLGCGPGFLTPFLAASAKTVVGVDFSAKAVAAARKRCTHLDNASFVEGDILDLDLNRRFDVITGRMFLHEVMHDDTPRFLRRLDSLLAEDGFLCFHENSYFNPAARFIRRRLVGRYGIPKHGSENELPFDAARFAAYREFFPHCERYVDAVEFIQKLYHYFIPIQRDWLGNMFLGADQLLTRFQARTGVLDNWSYVQTIYASRTVPRSEALCPSTPRAEDEEPVPQ